MNLKDRLVRTARGIAAAIKEPPYFAPGHYYSSTTSPEDRERAVSWRDVAPVGIDLREDEQVLLAHDIGLTSSPWVTRLGRRYNPDNNMYGFGDAATLSCMIRHFKPNRVIEVGSGWSTAVILDTAEMYLPNLRVTCVEPYTERLDSVLFDGDDVNIIAKPVQDVPVTWFADLEAGDILFIDSTHVLKSGSDVVWLYLHVLPTLAPGVIVHIHDVHWPFEYPEDWIREGRDWTELYLLRAFLTHNTSWEILLMTHWLWTQREALVPVSLRSEPTGSLWMRKTG